MTSYPARNRAKLDYAPPDRPPPLWSRPWVAALLAFPGCWLLTLFLYWASTFPDGFEDEVFHWDEGLLVMGVFGSPPGVVVYVVAGLLLMRHRAEAARPDNPPMQRTATASSGAVR